MSPTAEFSTADPLFPDGGRASGPAAAQVAVEALGWVGTPYRHQGSRRGVGCDCLGLVRGIWQTLYGVAPEEPGAYAPDWAEAGGAERLMDAVRRHFREKATQEGMPGDLLLFRWRPHLPAKHLGILVDDTSFVHAYEGAGAVVRSALVPQWRRRIAATFAFPDRHYRSI
jgi:NlpC/P60 family putative phage cell wall peptidase